MLNQTSALTMKNVINTKRNLVTTIHLKRRCNDFSNETRKEGLIKENYTNYTWKLYKLSSRTWRMEDYASILH